jgi:hypothetical protein
MAGGVVDTGNPPSSSNWVLAACSWGGAAGAPAYGGGRSIHYPGYMVPGVPIAGLCPDLLWIRRRASLVYLAWKMVFGAERYTIYGSDALAAGFKENTGGEFSFTCWSCESTVTQFFFRVHAVMPP